MNRINMDVDSVRRAKSDILLSKTTLSDALSGLDQKVNQAIGYAWISPSANEFNDQYNSMRNQIVQGINQLEDLANNLEKQIQRWEDMAASLH